MPWYNDPTGQDYPYKYATAYTAKNTAVKGYDDDEAQLNALESMQRDLRILTEKQRKKKGQIVGTTLNLIQDANPTFIDFELAAHNVNIPAGDAVRTPGVLLYGIFLLNLGPGTLYYSVNMYSGETGSVALPNGAERSFEDDRPKYKTLNLRATGANCQVNIGMSF